MKIAIPLKKQLRKGERLWQFLLLTQGQVILI